MGRILFLAGVLWCCALAAEDSPRLLTPVPGEPQAPELRLKDLDGHTHRLSDMRGQVVIVNFWATWCPPCREEMPSMERAWKTLKGEGVIMLGVNVGEDPDTVFTFLADYPVSFPLLLDQDGATTREWPMQALPTTFVVDPHGRLAYRAIGGREWDNPEILSIIRALGETPAPDPSGPTTARARP